MTAADPFDFVVLEGKELPNSELRQLFMIFARYQRGLGLVILAALWCLAPVWGDEWTTLVSNNASWRLFKGLSEASSPDATAWRQTSFDDHAWTVGPAPFFYGETLTPGTSLTNMQNQFSTFFLRTAFQLTNVSDVSALELQGVCDDGFIAWLNGVEIVRYNVQPGEPRFDGLSYTNVTEPVAFQSFPVANSASALLPGANVLAVQVFNVSRGSSDIVFDARLKGLLREGVPPTVVSSDPPPGPVTNLTQITVVFSEPVTGVDAADLRVNDLPATSVTGGGTTYTFTFPPPEFGTVAIFWDMRCGIGDLNTPPNLFNPTGPGARWDYQLLDSSHPRVISVTPPAGGVVRQLTAVEVLFDRPVGGVDAGDLLINGQPAVRCSGVSAGPYVFEFGAQAPGAVTLAWAVPSGIADLSLEPRLFEGGSWSCTIDPQLPEPQVIINEFMAENVNRLADEDGETQDWIELLNRGTNRVDLEGWALSDDPAQPGQWTFPKVTLAPGEYLVVFASGKDRRIAGVGRRLHTNFKLSVEGEYLGLANGEYPRRVVSELAPKYPPQRNNYSYGLTAAGDWRYFATATPGGVNGASLISAMVEPVHFSVSRGFFGKPFNLSLACATPEAWIRYTTNGSLPTETNGVLYTNLIPVTATRIIRAAAFRTNWLPSRVDTHTYLVNLPVSRRYLPALSLVTASNNLYGQSGIMEVNPRNTTKHGLAWERPVSAELIRPEDNGGFHLDCGIRVQGGGYVRNLYDYRSSQLPYNKYSFRLYFRGDYGPGRLEYPLLPGITLQSFDAVSLRAGMNDPTNPYIRDELVRQLESDVGQVAAHGTFVNLFLNGVYKGYYNPTERIGSDFFRAWHGGTNDWDLMAMSGEVREGDNVAWEQLRAFIRTNSLAVATNYQQLERRMDLTNTVEYLLPLIYGDVDDWPHNNWRAARERTPTGLYRFYAWDAEWSFGYNNGPSHNTIANQLGTTTPPWSNSEIAQMFNKLKLAPEFRLLFADRVHKHFFNGGAMTDERIKARYEWLKSIVTPTISGFDNTIGSNWIPNRRRYLTNHFALAGLLASSNAPVFSQFGGRVTPGFALTLSAGVGTIYYTTNGADPRTRFTGKVSGDALAYSAGSPLVLDRSLLVRARTQWNTNWSAVTEAAFLVEEFGSPVRISELMYHPPGGEAYEYIELQNPTGVAIDLSGMSLRGVEYRFLEGSRLEAGGRLVLASNADPAAFTRRYPGVAVYGWFGGSLANGGETIALLDRQGRVVFSVIYDDGGDWPSSADGSGASLEIVDPMGNPRDPANWQASVQAGGTPGAAPSNQPAQGVCLNEIHAAESLTNRIPPSVALENDWIELRNLSPRTVDLGGWVLTDRADEARFVFPTNTLVEANSLLVVYADSLTNQPGLHTGFALDRNGESVFLINAQAARADAVTFGHQLEAFTIGRAGEGAGLWQLCSPTLGAANQPAPLAAATNLVLNEFVANAPAGGDDWIELANRDADLPVATDGLVLATTNSFSPLPALSFIAPGGLLAIAADASGSPNHLDFRLDADKGVVVLYDRNGSVLSSVSYKTQAEGVSWGRFPDRNGAWASLFPTPSQPNRQANQTQGLVINEVMAYNLDKVTNALGQTADWVEIYNPTGETLSLAGMTLGLGVSGQDRWTFPADVELAADRFLVVWCSDTQPASTNQAEVLYAGRALPREGGMIDLHDARGLLVDHLAYGPQLANRSVGRIGNVWSLMDAPTPGAVNTLPALLGNAAAVRLNEWMVNGDGGDWVELFNPDRFPVDLGNFTLTDDPSLAGQTKHILPPVSLIAGQGHLVLKADGLIDRGVNHLSFSLDAEGETIRLYDASLAIVDSVDYPPQPAAASQGRFPDGGTNVLTFSGTVSPSAMNYVVPEDWAINEVLASPIPPKEAAIELANPSATPIAVGGWYLSTSPTDPRQFRLPDDARLPARGYLVLYGNQFAADGGASGRLTFDPLNGGEVMLSAVDQTGQLTGYQAHAPYGPTDEGLSFGRTPTSVGTDFSALAETSFGEDQPSSVFQFREGRGRANAPARVGPVVLNEIMYEAPALGETGVSGHFIELRNLIDSAVSLQSPTAVSAGWRLRGTVDYAFPSDLVLPGGGSLLLVPFDPATNAVARAAFLARYALASEARLLGPWHGTLGATEGTLQLLRPHLAATTNGPWIEVDRAIFSSRPPWPTIAASGVRSLQRGIPVLLGSDPAAWVALPPNPGAATPAHPSLDADGDGLPDEWEWAHHLNPDSAMGLDGANGDPDHDGLTNLQEFLAHTDPEHVDVLVSGAQVQGNQFVLSFNGIAGRSYRIETADAMASAQWQFVANVVGIWETAPVTVRLNLPEGVAARFYRVGLVTSP